MQTILVFLLPSVFLCLVLLARVLSLSSKLLQNVTISYSLLLKFWEKLKRWNHPKILNLLKDHLVLGVTLCFLVLSR